MSLDGLMENKFVLGLLLSAGAGLSTTVGSLIGLAVKKPGPKFLSFTLGFSAGVMILVSFVELLAKAIESIGFVPAHMGFFGGMIAYFLIDLLIPHDYSGQHDHPESVSDEGLMRTSLLVALGIGIHNFPEGMASFVGTLQKPELGVAIAIAIAIHNIPEGLAVSAPVYLATGSRSKAFLWSFLSGVSELVGAGIAALVLWPILNDTVLGWVLSAVGGIMVAISLDELMPTAKSMYEGHIPILGAILGMMIMAASLAML
ncbi:MAG TPA: zinc transporter ZupT [Candidatus Brocadiia bacterium]|nr:zinc transporter ZupT [Candidatus Brocadiia bacterium]